MVLKTARTLRSKTRAMASSAWWSNAAPHVAPALASRMSTWSVCRATAATSCRTPSCVALSAGTEMATAPGARFGSALSARTAALARRLLARRDEHLGRSGLEDPVRARRAGLSRPPSVAESQPTRTSCMGR